MNNENQQGQARRNANGVWVVQHGIFEEVVQIDIIGPDSGYESGGIENNLNNWVRDPNV